MVLIVATTFLLIFSLVMACGALFFAHEKAKKRKQFAHMLTAEAGSAKPANELLRPAAERSRAVAWFEKLPQVERLQNSIRHSGANWRATHFVLACAAGAVLGCIAGVKINLLSLTAISAALLTLMGACLPMAVLARKRSRHIKAFEEQFPEALDFLTRCLRAGHGLGSGLALLAVETPNPLGPAIRRVSNELQLGSPLDVAMQSLAETVPLVDVRIFISAVVIQRETGGNLGEILGRLAGLIRQRVQLRGKIAALSAHGRITGLVLLMIPIAVLLMLSVISPDYVNGLTQDATGRKLLIGAAAGQVLAYLSIKKIVSIKA